MKKAKDYITSVEKTRINYPLVIHAESGIGKTSIMAMIMKNTPAWLQGKSHTKLIRFLGTTPNTHNLFDIIFSVLGQIADAYDLIIPPINYVNIKALLDYMPRFFRQVSSNAREPVIILLDSIDQMSGALNAFAMKWLPLTLPSSVKLIISTLPEEHGILKNLKKLLPNPECYVEVKPLPENTGKQILQMFLKKSRRQITEEQRNLFLSAFRKSPSPLFLKLLMEQARTWQSYTPASDITLALTVVQAINTMFENLEIKFGCSLVKHALGYLTVGMSGLTEFEIEDVLSCDDVVLSDVYKFHDPPVPGIVTIPPVLWARIHYDIQEYLTERLSFGKSTLNWYHRQFIETATERYTKNGKDVELHANLTEIFLQENGVKRSITLKNRNNLTIEDADRQVKPQPFSVLNRRKLAGLPYHANRALGTLGKDFVKSKVLCNFQFLCLRIAAFSVATAVKDFSDFLEITCDDEVEILQNFISLSKDNLVQPARFAFCLQGGLNATDDQKNLKQLVEDAKAFMLSQSKPGLIPAFPCLAQRNGMSGAMLTSLQGIADILAETSNAFLLRNQEGSDATETEESVSEYAVFNVDTQEVTSLNLQLKVEMVGELYMNDTNVYYASQSAVNVFDCKTQKTVQHAFKTLIPFWKDSDKLQAVDFVTDSDASRAAIVFDSRIALLNLQKMISIQKFTLDKPEFKFQTCLITRDEAVIGLGVVNRAGAKDQGPGIQYFACKFTVMDKAEYCEIDKQLNFDIKCFTGKEEYMYIAQKTTSKGKEPKAEENSAKSEKQTVLRINLKNMAFEDPLMMDNEILNLIGHPEEQKAVAMTTKGTVYVLTTAVEQEVSVSSPAVSMAVLWDENCLLLGSESGNISVYNFEKKINSAAFTACSSKIKDINILQQTCVTLGCDSELKVWSLNMLLGDMKVTDEKTSESSELYLNLVQQMNVTAIAISDTEEELFTCTKDGFLYVWDFKTFKLIKRSFIEIAGTLMHPLKVSLVVHDKPAGNLKILNPFTGDCMLRLPSSVQNVLASLVNPTQTTMYLLSAPKKGREQIDIVNVDKLHFVKSIVIQQGLSYKSLDLVLSHKERYLVIKSQISEEEFLQVKALWKTGGFSSQNHRHKFHAVELGQGTGALIRCNRQMSKIPCLGNNIQPCETNMMAITTRR